MFVLVGQVALPDCDVGVAASDIVASFSGCCGQRCMAASVLLLVGEQPDLVKLIVDKSAALKPGTVRSDHLRIGTCDTSCFKGFVVFGEPAVEEGVVGYVPCVVLASTRLACVAVWWVACSVGQGAGQVGPIIDAAGKARCIKYISEAEANGATILLDGRTWCDRSPGNWVSAPLCAHLVW